MTLSLALTLALSLAAQGMGDDGLPPDFDADGLPADAPAEAPAKDPPSTTKDDSEGDASTSKDSNKGDANKGDANKGDANKGDANKGDASKDDAGGDSDKIEFVGDGDGPATFEALPLPTEEIADSEAPVIDDLAIAAQNPNGAPYVTAVITDDASGVASAIVYSRAPGKLDFVPTPLVANDGGLFLGQLPMGLQRTGFDYYVEVFDAQGNGPARIGSEDNPLKVIAAGMGELEREKIPTSGPEFAVHPAWVMLAVGAGILAAGVSGIFWYDLGGLLVQRGDIEERLGVAGLSQGDRTELETERAAVDNALLGDVVIAGILTAISATALGTGVGMLVYSELE